MEREMSMDGSLRGLRRVRSHVGADSDADPGTDGRQPNSSAHCGAHSLVVADICANNDCGTDSISDNDFGSDVGSDVGSDNHFGADHVATAYTDPDQQTNAAAESVALAIGCRACYKGHH